MRCSARARRSISWSFNVLDPNPRTEDGWWLANLKRMGRSRLFERKKAAVVEHERQAGDRRDAVGAIFG
ncbi:MAG: hypothetical protein R3D99_10155 [Altererythrobacter sp.]